MHDKRQQQDKSLATLLISHCGGRYVLEAMTNKGEF